MNLLYHTNTLLTNKIAKYLQKMELLKKRKLARHFEERVKKFVERSQNEHNAKWQNVRCTLAKIGKLRAFLLHCAVRVFGIDVILNVLGMRLCSQIL